MVTVVIFPLDRPLHHAKAVHNSSKLRSTTFLKPVEVATTATDRMMSIAPGLAASAAANNTSRSRACVYFDPDERRGYVPLTLTITM